MYLKDPIKRVQYTFRIKEDLMEDLKVYAKEKDIKLPRLLNDIIEEYLEGMNMSNTWSDEPLGVIITLPKEMPIKYHADVLIPHIDGLQYEVKAMPYNLDSWNDKYGYIANTKGVKHKGVEPLLIPGLIKDIELKNDKATSQYIVQCLFGLYFVLHDNDKLNVEIISHNNATEQLQFINPNLAKIYAQYRKKLYDIINDNLARLNETNHDKIKQELLEDMEELATTINTGNIVPIIAPAEDNNILQSDNPHLNGSKPKFIPIDGNVQFGNSQFGIYEDMQNRIDELEKENEQYKNKVNKLWENLNDMEVRAKVWEDIKKDNEMVQNKLDKIEKIFTRLDELEDKHAQREEVKQNNDKQ